MARTLPTYEFLESLCVERRRPELLKGVRQLLVGPQPSSERFSRCMEWLARAGLFKEVLRLSMPPSSSALDMDPVRLGPERSLWIAWSWTVLDAASFGRQLFGRLKNGRGKLAPELQILSANLLQAQGRPAEALQLLQSLPTQGLSEPWRWSRFQTQLRCLALLGRHQEGCVGISSFKNQDSTLYQKNEIHFTAIEAYFNGAAGRLSEAIARLEGLLDMHPDMGRTHPRILTYALRVLGAHWGRNGDLRRARAYFARALRSTRQHTGLRTPSAELEVLAHYAEAGLANERQLERLRSYPGLRAEWARMIPEKLQGTQTQPSGAAGPQVRWLIDIGSGEMRHKGRTIPECPKELLLAAFLLRSDLTGMSIPHACTLLWPDEAWNWFQLQERLPKLIQRLRKKYGIEITRRDERLQLRSLPDDQTLAGFDSGSPLPSFLRELMASGAPEFNAMTVAAHYQVGKRQAINLIRGWAQQGWIHTVGRGPATRYRCSPQPITKTEY